MKLRILWYLLSLAVAPTSRADKISSLPVAPNAPALVRTFPEFTTYMKEHTIQVEVLALHFFDKVKDRYPGVDREILADVIRYHDRSKLDNTPAFLQKHGVKVGDSLPPPNRLFLGYGADFRQLTDADKKYHMATVNEFINPIDEAVMKEALARHGITPEHPLFETYLYLEKIPDLVARGEALGTAEEMAKKVLPASKFFEGDLKRLTESGGDPQKIAKLQQQVADARLLEGDYKEIITWNTKGFIREVEKRFGGKLPPYDWAVYSPVFDAVQREWVMPRVRANLAAVATNKNLCPPAAQTALRAFAPH